MIVRRLLLFLLPVLFGATVLRAAVPTAESSLAGNWRIDLARSTEQATTQLLEDLRWLGLHWDNERLVYQSKRLDVYNRVIDDLAARGLAYEAWETPEELDTLRKDAERTKRQFVYRRRAARCGPRRLRQARPAASARPVVHVWRARRFWLLG